MELKMSIIRTKKDQKFFVASNALFNDKNLSWEAKGIMGYLLSKPDGWQCHNYDLVNQGPAGKHIIQRVLKELKEAGYIHRYQESDGTKIEWVTEVYETPELNTTSRNTNIPPAEKPTVGIPADGKSGDIVNTDSQEILISGNTDKASSAEADYSRPISLLSEKEIKALKLPLADWQQHLADEQAERNRAGVLKFLKAKVAAGPLLPDTDASKSLFEKLEIEARAKGRAGPKKFPTLACKEKFNQAAGRLNGTLNTAIDNALAAGITAIPRLVNYISSPKWQENSNERRTTSPNQTSQRRTSSQASRTAGANFAPPPGSGQTPEMAAKLRAHFAPK
jgi:hypothetical protein